MTKDKLMGIWISALIVLLVLGVAIASLQYNVSNQTIVRTLSALSLLLASLGRLFHKKPPLQSPREKKLISSINALAGWSILVVVLGLVIGFNILGFLEQRGVHSSGFEILALMIVFPVTVVLIYLKKRSSIMRNLSDKQMN
jgi:hypothetical protein